MLTAAGVAGNNIAFSNPNSDLLQVTSGITSLSGGGQTWATAAASQNNQTNLWHLQLTGSDRGANYDITLADPNTLLSLANLAGGAYDEDSDFTATTDASGSGNWDGADILTQTAAQEALGQIQNAILIKDTQRANLGALQNRLENTITNLTIQSESLVAAESRISDIDVASEMTEFTKNNILVQAATAMLAQANQIPQLALQLIGG